MLYHSWRWFGPADTISLKEVRQTGARGIVSALHQVPTGEVWAIDRIRERKRIIEDAGLTWSVVESVPVHEDIKLQAGDFRKYTENYKQTIRNLGSEGIGTLCYNFMPVLDWSRTDLKFTFNDGSESLYFDYTLFALIDIYILKRPGAAGSYPEKVRQEAGRRLVSMDRAMLDELEKTFLLGLPGSGETFSIEQVLKRIARYDELDNLQFRANLSNFIREIAPVAEESHVRLAIHPDDPPWTLMGLPKAVSTLEDAREIISAYNSPYNGIAFCTGSFGASVKNDLPEMAKVLAPRINFAHLRNVTRDEECNFHEDYFFEGDIDMYSIMRTLVQENNQRMKQYQGYQGIPVRPDHGTRILGDFDRTTYPGYALYGRMKSLAEIRGLEIGIARSLEE